MPTTTFRSSRPRCPEDRRLGHADPAFTLRTYVHLLDDGFGEVGFLDDAVAAVEPHAAGRKAA